METAPQRFTQVAPLYRREARDAFPVVAASTRSPPSSRSPHLTAAGLRRHARRQPALRGGAEGQRVDAALAEDDAFHAMFVDVSANGEIPRVLDRLMPRVRRLERMRFGSLAGRDSVASTSGSSPPPRPRTCPRPQRWFARTGSPSEPSSTGASNDRHDSARHPRSRDAGDRPRAAGRGRRTPGDAARGARGGLPQRARGAARSASTCSPPRRWSARRSRSSCPPRSARERPRATSARSTAGSRARGTSTRSRRWPSSCSRSSSRPTTPSTAWWPA